MTATCLACRCAIVGAAGLCGACAAEFVGQRTHHTIDDTPDAIACGLLEGVRRSLINTFKVDGVRRAGRVLADDAVALVAQRFPGCTLVPIPPNPRARRRRGFDQTLLLAHTIRRGLAATCCAVGVASLLVRRRGTAQKTLNKQQRARNLLGKLQVRRDRPVSGPVVLLDDVYTTGASLSAARSVLLATGVAIAGAVVIAHTA